MPENPHLKKVKREGGGTAPPGPKRAEKARFSVKRQGVWLETCQGKQRPFLCSPGGWTTEAWTRALLGRSNFCTEQFLERFNFAKGETRGGGTAPPGPE